MILPPGCALIDVPDVNHTALADVRRVERIKIRRFDFHGENKSRQQHEEDCVRCQIEADQPRSHRCAVDARAVEAKALQRPLPEECVTPTHPM